ncbi:MAG TPA: hypothetical protein VGM05_13050 [Planctomycetaceae bacterium]|jgi:hypothetical protein
MSLALSAAPSVSRRVAQPIRLARQPAAVPELPAEALQSIPCLGTVDPAGNIQFAPGVLAALLGFDDSTRWTLAPRKAVAR